MILDHDSGTLTNRRVKSGEWSWYKRRQILTQYQRSDWPVWTKCYKIESNLHLNSLTASYLSFTNYKKAIHMYIPSSISVQSFYTLIQWFERVSNILTQWCTSYRHSKLSYEPMEIIVWGTSSNGTLEPKRQPSTMSYFSIVESIMIPLYCLVHTPPPFILTTHTKIVQ